jgi:hypothetical protein
MSNPSDTCVNCGAERIEEEQICASCGADPSTGELDMSPPTEKKRKSKSGRKNVKTTPPGKILETVLKKRAKQGVDASAFILHAIVKVDLGRRDIRPVDEVPPSETKDRLVLLDKEIIPFGRTSTVLPIKDSGVSRAHGEIVRQSDGSFCIRDCGSANGTYVNGTKLQAEKLHKIKPGDKITIGFWHVIEIHWGRPGIDSKLTKTE